MSVCAVIVTYCPDEPRLAALLRVLRQEVDFAVVVDNGSPQLPEALLRELLPGLLIERFNANRGLAAGQNRGIALAKAAGASYVLFLDQDSVPRPGMTRVLLEALDTLQARGIKAACAGPRHRMPGSDVVSAFRRVSWFGPRVARCPGDGTPIECDFLISSGSLVPVRVLDAVGGMEEALFIDQVDTEWCLRARAKGYRVFGACGALLEHRLGEGMRRIWLGRWRRFFRHRPFRYYYIFRNTLALARRDYVEPKVVLFLLCWLAAVFVVFGLAEPRSGSLRMMLKGLYHGLAPDAARPLVPAAAATQPNTGRG